MRIIFVLLIAAFISTTALTAQELSDKQTFVTEDGTFSFEYPDGWFVEVVNSNFGPNAHLSLDNLPLDQRFEAPDSLNLQLSLPKHPYEFVFSRGSTPQKMVAASIGIAGEPPMIDFATPSADGTPQPLQLPLRSRK